MTTPRIAIPIPTTKDLEYNRKSWQNYAVAVERSGGVPVAVPLDLPEGESASLIAGCSGVLLPGSPADVDPRGYGQEPIEECTAPDPARETVDRRLLEDARRTGKPVLTICFGTQMLNVWLGGTLLQDVLCVPVNHRAGGAVAVAHGAVVAPDSLLGHLVAGEAVAAQGDEVAEGKGFLSLPINSSHHQAVAVPGEGLRISARSAEDGIVEAIEGPLAPEGQFLLGVQWHPERSFEISAASRALFARLIAEARAWQGRQSAQSAA